jgi:hypothetical protein
MFRVGYRDAGGFDEVAPHWYTYSGNETAALGYQIALDGVGFRIWDGNNTNDARPPVIDGWSAVVPSPGFASVDFSKNIPLVTRSITFGLADEERFSIEGTVNYTPHAAAAKTLELGGLEGERAFQAGLSEDEPEELRSVFSKADVAPDFIEDFYFEEPVNGVTFRIRFYYIIG